MPYFDEIAGEAISDALAASDEFLLGRKTYEILSGFFVPPDDDLFAATMNSLAAWARR